MQPKGTRSAFTEVRWDRFSGWTLTIILCALPLIIWLQLHPFSLLANGDFSSTMRDIGRVTGLIGMVMYALNLIYSTRLRFTDEGLTSGYKKATLSVSITNKLSEVQEFSPGLALKLTDKNGAKYEPTLKFIPPSIVLGGPIDASKTIAIDVDFEIPQNRGLSNLIYQKDPSASEVIVSL